MNPAPRFWKQWLIVVFVLSIIAVIVWLGFPQLSDEYYAEYIMETCGPRLRKQLGFKTSVDKHQRYGADTVFYISTTDKGGVFDRAGVKPGFIPLGYRGSAINFYSELEEARGEKTTLRFIEAAPNRKDIIHTIELDVPR